MAELNVRSNSVGSRPTEEEYQLDDISAKKHHNVPDVEYRGDEVDSLIMPTTHSQPHPRESLCVC